MYNSKEIKIFGKKNISGANFLQIFLDIYTDFDDGNTKHRQIQQSSTKKAAVLLTVLKPKKHRAAQKWWPKNDGSY